MYKVNYFILFSKIKRLFILQDVEVKVEDNEIEGNTEQDLDEEDPLEHNDEEITEDII